MLTLLLLRHAKAVPQGGDDFFRALTDKGHADAAALGVFLRDARLTPDLALVSPSSRTRETFEGLTATLGAAVTARYEEELYSATAQRLRDRLRDVDDSVKTLLIVGHNPAIMELSQMLADSGDRADFNAMTARFPPCSLVVVEFDREEWIDARQGGRLALFLTPDQLPRS